MLLRYTIAREASHSNHMWKLPTGGSDGWTGENRASRERHLKITSTARRRRLMMMRNKILARVQKKKASPRVKKLVLGRKKKAEKAPKGNPDLCASNSHSTHLSSLEKRGKKKRIERRWWRITEENSKIKQSPQKHKSYWVSCR